MCHLVGKHCSNYTRRTCGTMAVSRLVALHCSCNAGMPHGGGKEDHQWYGCAIVGGEVLLSVPHTCCRLPGYLHSWCPDLGSSSGRGWLGGWWEMCGYLGADMGVLGVITACTLVSWQVLVWQGL